MVLTLVGPLKSGLDAFRSEDVMIPVLFQDLVPKVVLTLVGSLKSGLHTFRMSRHNGSSLILRFGPKSGPDPNWIT